MTPDSRPSVISVGACQSHTVRGTNTHSVDLGLEAIGPVLYHALFEPSGKPTFQRKEEQREPVLKHTPTKLLRYDRLRFIAFEASNGSFFVSQLGNVRGETKISR